MSADVRWKVVHRCVPTNMKLDQRYRVAPNQIQSLGLWEILGDRSAGRDIVRQEIG